MLLEEAKTDLAIAVERANNKPVKCEFCGFGLIFKPITMESWNYVNKGTDSLFHCIKCKGRGCTNGGIGPFSSLAIGKNHERGSAEINCARAIETLDRVEYPEKSSRDAGQLQRGVPVGWLMDFLTEKVGDRDMKTYEVVQEIIQPETRMSRCRYCELPSCPSGNATIFISHSWGASFRDLVTATYYVVSGHKDAVVWIDIFAVRQYPGNVADLSFASVVRNTNCLVLISIYFPEVANLDPIAISNRTVEIPSTLYQMCAFFRVWCLVELASALAMDKPVVMVIGGSNKDNVFKPEPDLGMLINLYYIIDIENHASSSVPEDKNRILDDIKGQGTPYALDGKAYGIGIDALNCLARGSIVAARGSMIFPEVLSAVCGIDSPLKELSGKRHDAALVAAASGGYIREARMILQDGGDIEATDKEAGRTALMFASDSGKTEVVKMLLDEFSANIEASDQFNWTSLMLACEGGHVEVIKVLLAAGADINVTYLGDTRGREYGLNPLIFAAMQGHALAIEVLLCIGGANIKARTKSKKTALMYASAGGHEDAVKVLIKHNANVNEYDDMGKTALIIAKEAAELTGEEGRHSNTVKILRSQQRKVCIVS